MATVLANNDDAAKMRAAMATDIYFNIRKSAAIDRVLAPDDDAARIRRLAGEASVYSGQRHREFRV